MDVFLDRVCREKTKITVCFTGGESVTGVVESFNDTTIWLENNHQQEIVINRNMIIYIVPKKK
ncbi:MAG: RNA-binding protein Hfq [Dehalococcoidia bacterium]|nr:RNA-binding protein Hfq [Bacillota bacterium]